MADISIIIPVRSEPPALELTLRTLFADKQAAGAQVLVVNDGSSAAISGLVSRYAALGVSEIQNTENRGSYYCRNLGIRQAKGSFLFFIDAGLELPPQWLHSFMELAVSGDYIAGNVTVEKKHGESLAERFYRCTAFDMKAMFDRYHCGGAGFMMVKKEVTENIGMFDNRLYSGADNEFGSRVYLAGYRQVFAEHITAVHKTRSWKSQFRVLLRIYSGRNKLSALYPGRYGEFEISLKKLVLLPARYLSSLRSYFRPGPDKLRDESGFFSYFYCYTVYYFMLKLVHLIILFNPRKEYNTR